MADLLVTYPGYTMKDLMGLSFVQLEALYGQVPRLRRLVLGGRQ